MRSDMPVFLRGVLTALATGLVLLAPAAPVAGMDKVRLQLRYAHQFQFAGYYAAKWRGYYSAAGIDAELISGMQADGRMIRPTDSVADGRADFGIGAGDILLAVDHGVPLVIVAAIFQQSPVAVFAKSETGLASPADLTRLTVLSGQSPLVDAEVLAMLRAEGIDPALLSLRREADLMPVQGSWDGLKSGRIDALVGYALSIPWYAKEQNIQLTQLRPSVYGVDFYGDSLFTHRRLLVENPDLVQRFRQASIAGWHYALQHPDEIIDRIVAELPQDPAIKNRQGYNHFLFESIRKLMLYPIIEIGHSNPERWEGMHESLRTAGLVKRPIDIDALIYDPGRLREAREFRAYLIATAILATLILLVLALQLRTRLALKRTRLRAQEEIHRTQAHQQRLLAILAAAPEFVGIADQNERVLYINPAGRRMLGLGKDEDVSGAPIAAFHPHDVGECIAREGLPYAARGGTWSCETAFLTRDGREIPVSQTIIAHKSEHGAVEFYSTIARDISEQRRAEQRIRSHLHYLSTMDRINAIFLDAPDLETMLNNVLQEMLYIFHCDRAWLLHPCNPDGPVWNVPMERTRPGWPGAFSLHEDQPMTPATAAAIRRILATDGPVVFSESESSRILTGEHFSIRAQIVCGIDPKTGDAWLLGIHHCAEAHEFSAEEINIFKIVSARVADFLSSLLILADHKRSEAKYRNLIEHIPQRVFLKDTQSVYVSCNEKFAQDLGTCSDAIAGKTDFDFHPRELAEKYRLDDAMIMRTGSTAEIDEPYILNGAERWAHTVKTPVLDEQGNTIGVLGIFWDITEQKQLADELVRHREHLEELVADRTEALVKVNNELEAFTYAVSHDLRAPLRGIGGFSKALAEDYHDTLDAGARDYLRRIQESTGRMGELIESLLSLSKVSRQALHSGPVNLSELAQIVANRLKEQEPDRHVEIIIQAGVVGTGDQGLLTIALENLLGNAWKYSQRIAQARIEFGVWQDGGEAVYFVTDNGAGFDMQYADKLFTAFQRFHMDDEFPGTGIGLATVQRIIHRHGGRIWATSEVGKGANFYFTLGTRASIAL